MTMAYATLTGPITLPGSDIGVRARIIATPLTTDQLLTYTGDDRFTAGPVVGETNGIGALNGMKVPTNSDLPGLLWQITAERLDKGPGPAKWTIKHAVAITGTGTVKLRDLVEVDVLTVDSTLVASVSDLAAAADASKTAAAGSATTAAGWADAAASSAADADTSADLAAGSQATASTAASTATTKAGEAAGSATAAAGSATTASGAATTATAKAGEASTSAADAAASKTAAQGYAAQAAGSVSLVAWAPTTVYAAGDVRQAPDGSTIKRTANGTSRASFDATEEAAWTAVAADGTTIVGKALTASYVGKNSRLKFVSDFMGGGVSSTTAVLNMLAAGGSGSTFHFEGLDLATLEDIVEFDGYEDFTVDARGSVLDLADDGTAEGRIFRIKNASGWRWYGGRITQTAAARTGVYGLLTLDTVDDFGVYDLDCIGGSSTSIWTKRATNGVLRVRGRDNKADGIHITRGSTDIQVYAQIKHVGDDAIAVVSVTNDGATAYEQCARISVIGPTVDLTGSPLGGGVAFIGCKDSVLLGGTLANTPDAAFKCTLDAVAGTHTPANNSVVGTRAVNAAAGGYRVGTSTDTTLYDVTATDCGAYGVGFIGATRAKLKGGKLRGNLGGFYESGGSGNRVEGVDLTGNTSFTVVRDTAVITGCEGYNTQPYLQAIVLIENGDRPDNATTTGLATSGQAPTVYTGTFGLIGNKVYNPVGAAAQQVWDVGTSNHQISATLPAFAAAGQYHGLIARASDANNFYWADAESGGNVRLFKRVGGTNTQLGSTVAAGFTAGDQLSLSVNEHTLTVYRNGTAVITTTDSSLLFGTGVGCRNGSTSTTQQWENIVGRAL